MKIISKNFLSAVFVSVSLIAVLIAKYTVKPIPPLSVDARKIAGNLSANKYLVEFFDYECPFCRHVYPTVKASLAESPSVKIIFKHFPLTTIHPRAVKAAEASECAADQNRFLDFHNKLFEEYDQWYNSDDFILRFKTYAKQLSLDQNQFDFCLDSNMKQVNVFRDKEEGKIRKVSSVPTFLINGTKIITSVNSDELHEVISHEFSNP